MRTLLPILSLFFLSTIIACVPARKYDDLQTKYTDLDRRFRECSDQLTAIQANHEELTENHKLAKKEITRLEKDLADFKEKYADILDMNDRLNEQYEKLLVQNEELLKNTSRERDKIALELDKKEHELLKKNQELRDKERLLENKESELKLLSESLEEREMRVAELESMIARQDSAVNALRRKVTEALLNFNSDELTVEMRDGKVYVSLSEQLLFKSGSTQVDPKGKDALGKLAEVLKKNPDIDILVEGHTDNVPLKGSGHMQDNWDLSVLRATSIVKLLENYGVPEERMQAAGRGENYPVATNETPEGRSKNRRTEIILSPKLDELFNILSN